MAGTYINAATVLSSLSVTGALTAGSIALGSTPAATGVVRGPKPSETAALLTFNQNDGLADVTAILTDTSNNVVFKSSTTGASAYLDCANAGSVGMRVSGAARVTANGTGLGFFAAAPVAQPSAYTQTYATATKTHAALTSATLTDSTTGTADTTVANVGAAFSQATLNNNFADVIAQINALRVDVVNAKGVLNSAIDDLQALGLLQ